MLRVAFIAVLAVCCMGAKVTGLNLAPQGLSPNTLHGSVVRGLSLASMKSSVSTAWADCDFGGALPTPVLAYNFNSVDRTVMYLGSPLTNYHSSSSKAASISPSVNQEIHCNTAFSGPYCGTYNATGGPDGAGQTGSAYYDLSSGSGTAHRLSLIHISEPTRPY